jgi:outer membrane murein-binding lipoprotein Lpp
LDFEKQCVLILTEQSFLIVANPEKDFFRQNARKESFMKNSLIVMFLTFLMLVPMSGCLEPSQVQQIATQQAELQSVVDNLQVTAAGISKQLTAGGILDPNLNQKVAHLNEQINKLQSDTMAVADAVKNVKLSGDNLLDFVAMLRAGNAASTAFNPYALPIEAGLGALSVLLAWLAKLKSKEAAQNKTALSEVVTGVEIAKGYSDEISDTIKDAQSITQSSKTTELVAQARSA